MGNEWKEIKLKDFVSLQRGHDLPTSKRKDGSVPIMGSFGITGYHDEVKMLGPGVTIGRSGGSMGVVNYIEEDYWPLNTALYITDFKGNDPFFTYLFLSQIDFTIFNSGSAQPSLNRNIIYGLDLKVPPVNEQSSITKIIKALDDKIELNRQMNQTLEQMAQALFKSWFVNFDPVIDNALAAGNIIPEPLQKRAEQRRLLSQSKQGDARKPLPEDIQNLFPAEFEFSEELDKWVPMGWKVKELGAFAMPQKGKNITKKNVIPGGVPVVAGGLNPSTYHNQSNTLAPVITISASGANAGFVNLYHMPVWSSDSSFVDKTITKYVYFTYQFLKYNQQNLFEKQEGTAQPHIYPRHVASFQLCLPRLGILEYFEAMAEANFKKVKNNISQTKALTQLRDALLPKLVSGEVRLSAEAMAQARVPEEMMPKVGMLK